MTKYISTVSYDQQEIIRDILDLHAEGQSIDCDPTYSVGNFYKHGIRQPKFRFDKSPRVPGVIESLSHNLPINNEEVSVIMFDPPFVIGGKSPDDAKDGSCITAKRFDSFQRWSELKNMYSLSLREFSRILKPGGIVIFKCQDTVAQSKQHFTHCWIMYEAIEYGFYPLDLFILLAKTRLGDSRKQQHARKFHSYYWVFKKRSNRTDYGIDGSP